MNAKRTWMATVGFLRAAMVVPTSLGVRAMSPFRLQFWLSACALAPLNLHAFQVCSFRIASARLEIRNFAKEATHCSHS